MQYFYQAYVVPSTRLSLERAREYDLKSNARAKKMEEFEEPPPQETEYGIESRRRSFDKNSYRQPVLTQLPTKPWMYRRGQEDAETVSVRQQLKRISRLSSAMSAASAATATVDDNNNNGESLRTDDGSASASASTLDPPAPPSSFPGTRNGRIQEPHSMV